MNADFSRIAILGGGLLGGSLAMALGRLPAPPAVRLWARKPETVALSLAAGISNATPDLAAAVFNADLLVLAVPVGAMPALLERAIDCGLPDDCLITDVGSVKTTPHRSLGPLLAGKPQKFIGSHPMAGSERNGIDAARPELFDHAACLLTNNESAPQALCLALERFWQRVGCRTRWMTAEHHDALVARISHLPHLLAASGARICLKTPSDGDFGGGGLRDTTRVASGNPSMWAEILTENRAAIIPPLREILADLTDILNTLEAGNESAAHTWLAEAKRLRDPLRRQP